MCEFKLCRYKGETAMLILEMLMMIVMMIDEDNASAVILISRRCIYENEVRCDIEEDDIEIQQL